MGNSGTEGRSKKRPFKQDLLKLTFKAEVAHWNWPYVRALWSSAIKGESPQQHHGHPDFPFTNADSRPGGTSCLLPSEATALLLCWVDAGLRPPAAGLQNAWDSYSSLAGSMVPLLHINAKRQTWNRAIRHPPSLPPTLYKQNVSFSFQLIPGSGSIYNLPAILYRCKLFHTMSRRLQSANKIL